MFRLTYFFLISFLSFNFSILFIITLLLKCLFLFFFLPNSIRLCSFMRIDCFVGNFSLALVTLSIRILQEACWMEETFAIRAHNYIIIGIQKLSANANRSQLRNIDAIRPIKLLSKEKHINTI